MPRRLLGAEALMSSPSTPTVGAHIIFATRRFHRPHRRYHSSHCVGAMTSVLQAPLSPYQLYTFAVPSPYLGRFMFGFRLKAKSEHEAAQVRRWYGEGVSDIPGLLGGITSRHSALSLSLGIKVGRAVRFALLDGKREDKSVINPIYSFIFMCRLST